MIEVWVTEAMLNGVKMLRLRKTSVALLGVGGYGFVYVNHLLNAASAAEHGVQLIGAVEPYPATAPSAPDLERAGVPIYATADELFARRRPDVVVIASPIQFHAQQTIQALAHGAHVLCEKPLCGSLEQARAMLAAKDRSDRQVAVGYQWSYSGAIQALKADILRGRFGAPRRCKTLVLWPRDEVYYTRNTWAGRRFTTGGLPVFDSPLNNACGHFVHNLLYLLGPAIDRSAHPRTVTAELYRANAIETFDSAAVRATIGEGVEMLTVVSHATADLQEPLFEIEFDRATVTYAGDRDGHLIVRLHGGATLDYGRPCTSSDADKLWSAIDSFRERTPVLCGIEAASAQAEFIDAVHRSMAESIRFPDAMLHISGPAGKRATAVEGLGPVLRECYATWSMPSEHGLPWAAPGELIELPAAPVPNGALAARTPSIEFPLAAEDSAAATESAGPVVGAGAHLGDLFTAHVLRRTECNLQ